MQLISFYGCQNFLVFFKISMQRVSSSSAVYKEATTGSKLSRGKSLGPESIQMLEQEAFLVIAANNKKAKSADNSSFDSGNNSSFSMKNYQSAEELKAKKQKSSSSSCCRAQPVVPRRETAQSAYSVCFRFAILKNMANNFYKFY